MDRCASSLVTTVEVAGATCEPWVDELLTVCALRDRLLSAQTPPTMIRSALAPRSQAVERRSLGDRCHLGRCGPTDSAAIRLQMFRNIEHGGVAATVLANEASAH